MNNQAMSKLTGPSVNKQLALNLINALKVAGPMRDDGGSSGLSSVSIQEQCGIARSTLRKLRDLSADSMPNPDLRTLTRVADVLQIPVSFLLMGQSEWAALGKMMHGTEYLAAAHKIVGMQKQNAHHAIELLVALKVHPERPPLMAEIDKQELRRLEARNEWRRRSCLIVAALAQQGARDQIAYEEVTAFAAAFVNQTTPSDPTSVRQ